MQHSVLYLRDMGNSRSLRRKLLTTVAAGLPVLGASPRVSSASDSALPRFPSIPIACSYKSIAWRAPGWEAGAVDLFTLGMNSWNWLRDKTGWPVLSASNGSQLTFIKRPPNSGYETVCMSGGLVEIHMDDSFGTGMFNHSAYHEPGHAFLGYNHDGEHDNLVSYGTTEPLMRGCGGTPFSQTADDWGRVTYRWDHAITPNGGFENPGVWFGAFSQIANPYSGNYDAEVAANTTISRPTRVTPAVGGYRLRGAYKHNSANSGTLKFNYRSVDYAAGTVCGHPYSPSMNWNSATVGAWVTGINLGLPKSSAWTVRNVALPGLPSSDGIDYWVLVSAPSDQAIYVDDVEVMT